MGANGLEADSKAKRVLEAFGIDEKFKRANPDIDNDGKIDLKDYYATCKNYGKSW